MGPRPQNQQAVNSSQENNFTHQNKSILDSESHLEHSTSGVTREKSNTYGPKEDTGGTSYGMESSQVQKEEISVTVECHPKTNVTISNDNKNSSDSSTPNTKSSQTLDQESISKGKTLEPFWNQSCLEKSNLLWSPTETDFYDSDFLLSNRYVNQKIPRSCVSITRNRHRNKNSSPISFLSSRFLPPESMGDGVTLSKRKSRKSKPNSNPRPSKKKPLDKSFKTITFRIFPSENKNIEASDGTMYSEKDILLLSIEQQRYYYNLGIEIINNETFRNQELQKVSKINIRNAYCKAVLRPSEEIDKDNPNRIQDLNNTNCRTIPHPDYWDTNNITIPKSVVKRGAVDKLTSSYKSALSNKRNGNISHFKMRFLSKKKPIQICRFDDNHIPSELRNIKSYYRYRSKDKRRRKITFQSLLKPNLDHKSEISRYHSLLKKYRDPNNTEVTEMPVKPELRPGIEKCNGVEYVHDTDRDLFFLKCPVNAMWFPGDDVRLEKQEMYDSYHSYRERTIALDPGVRTFLTGYDPEGNIITIGDGEHSRITKMFEDIDKMKRGEDEDKDEFKLRRRKAYSKIKNCVKEIHNKSILFLIENYDTILVPEYGTKSMISNNDKLNSKTKRMLQQYSFYSFKTKLFQKCDIYNKNFVLVTEEYTSKTCSMCGNLNTKLGSSKEYKCTKTECGIEMDRDVNGARNIFIKNMHLVKSK